MPPVEELYIADFSGVRDQFQIPHQLCRKIRKCATKSFRISFQSATPLLEEMRIIYSANHAGQGPQLPPIHSILKGGNAIRILEIRGWLAGSSFPAEPFQCTLENLQEITMTPQMLLTLFGGADYTLPSIRSFNIVTPVEVDPLAWEVSLSTKGISEAIQEISIPSMNVKDVEKIIPCINIFKALGTLRIHGDSVEPFLKSRASVLRSYAQDRSYSTNPTLEALNSLYVISYGGTGETILDFIEATKRCRLGSREETERHDPQKTIPQAFYVKLIDCPNILTSTRDTIGAQLRF